MYSDVLTKVGKAHQIMCSVVHTKVGAPYMKMCSDVNGDNAHEMCLNVHSVLGWGLQTKVGKPHMKMCSDVNKQLSPGLSFVSLVPNSKSVLYVLLVGDHPRDGRSPS